MQIFLIGFSGCGKSTIGKELARVLGIGFTDVDKAISAEQNRTVSQLFAVRGEAEFRKLEHDKLLRIIADGGDYVVATGGGLPCFGGNMELIKTHAIYLRRSISSLIARLDLCKQSRPLVRNMDVAQLRRYVTDTLIKREEFYNEASYIVDCDGFSDIEIVRTCARIYAMNG